MSVSVLMQLNLMLINLNTYFPGIGSQELVFAAAGDSPSHKTPYPILEKPTAAAAVLVARAKPPCSSGSPRRGWCRRGRTTQFGTHRTGDGTRDPCAPGNSST